MPIQFSRANLLSLYVPAFLLAVSNGLVLPALPLLLHSMSVSFVLATSAVGAQLLGSALTAVPAGCLLDLAGRRGVTISGLLLVALSGLLIPTATSLPALLLYQFLAGCGTQMWMLGRLTLLSMQTQVHDRGRQVTGMVGMENAGMLLGPALGGALTAALGVDAAFGTRCALCLAAALMVYLATKGASETRPPATGEPAPRLLKILTTPPLPKLTLLQFVVSLVRGSIFYGTLDLFMVYAYGAGPATIGLLRTVAGVVGIPVTLLAGQIMDRFGRKASLIPGFSLVAAGLAGMAVVSAAQLAFPYFVMLLFVVLIGISFTSGSMQTMGIDMAPPGWAGRFLGFLRLSTEFGSFLSPTGFGLIVAWSGYPAGFAGLAAIGAGVAGAIALWLPDAVAARRRAVPTGAATQNVSPTSRQ